MDKKANANHFKTISGKGVEKNVHENDANSR